MATRTDDDLLASLPRLAQDYTREQQAATVRFLSALSIAELRKRQELLDAFIAMAVAGGKPEEIILDLQTKREQLTLAVDLQAFGGTTWGIEWMKEPETSHGDQG